MRILATASFLACLAPATTWACGDTETAAYGAPSCDHESCSGWQKVTIKELNDLRKGDAVAILDVNSPPTRTKYGVIPGATLLSSAGTYDVARELPADKSAKLVFYCANKLCTASHQAAERAVGAGYKLVFVLSDGIMGWKEAGQPVTMPTT